MVKIRVSYDNEAELDKLIKYMDPVICSMKKSRNQTGTYKRAYLVVDILKCEV
jgi:hypothetical protein